MIDLSAAEVAELDRDFTVANESLSRIVGFTREHLEVDGPEMTCLLLVGWFTTRMESGDLELDALAGICAAALIRLARQS
ncbi:hypothetical protein A3N95_08490 [Mycobacteroides abscessus]|nr:hypothetical protein A3N95_08490 [Mycobacteroides abscessus]